jgi:hypothetical protein
MSGIPTSMRRLTEDELLAVAGGHRHSGVNVDQNTVNGTQTTTVNGTQVPNGTYTSTSPSLGLPPGTTVTIGTGVSIITQIN